MLEQAARGPSNRQIGDEQNIAEQTVKNHLSNAIRKLSLHDRNRAVVMAIGNGWISISVGVDQSGGAPHNAGAVGY